MVRTGSDAYSGTLDIEKSHSGRCHHHAHPMRHTVGWLEHVFYGNEMWNGYDCRNVSSFGAAKCGIEKTKEKMVGRGVRWTYHECSTKLPSRTVCNHA